MSSLSPQIQIGKDSYQSLRHALSANKPSVPFSGTFRFTKSSAQPVNQPLLRDHKLEDSTLTWIASRNNFNELLSRFSKFDSQLPALRMPRHYAMRFSESSTHFGNLENVFLFFPYATGFNAKTIDDIFSVELIDVSRNIYEQIVFPCVAATFSNANEVLASVVKRETLEKTIFLYSLFHELGHQVGPWKNSPQKDPGLPINGFPFAVMGELSADLLLLDVLSQFPEVALATLLIRLFWYRRRYDCKRDNDAWIGNLFWQRGIQTGLIDLNNLSMPRLDLARLQAFFSAALGEVLQLGRQPELTTAWMQKWSSPNNTVTTLLAKSAHLPFGLKELK